MAIILHVYYTKLKVSIYISLSKMQKGCGSNNTNVILSKAYANSCCNCICLLSKVLLKTGRCEMRSYITYNFELSD